MQYLKLWKSHAKKERKKKKLTEKKIDWKKNAYKEGKLNGYVRFEHE